MARFEEALQRFWLRDLHKVKGQPRNNFKSWILKRDYLITAPQLPQEFSLLVLNEDALLSAIAYESNRFSCAAFETVISIKQSGRLPRSTAWLIIQMYYAAFFGAHALLRMFGTLCLQIEGDMISALNRVATALGALPASGFERGFYNCTYDASHKLLRFKKSAAANRGSHEILWETFTLKLREMSTELLSTSNIYTSFAIKLEELDSILCEQGFGSGGWLSHVRNLVNYRHEYGSWFPYREIVSSAENLFQLVDGWMKDPMTISSLPGGKDHLKMHLNACALILSMCREVSLEMQRKCPSGRSFHFFGCAALMNQARL